MLASTRRHITHLINGQELYVNGVDQGHINGIRVPDYDGVRAPRSFIATSVVLICLRFSLSPMLPQMMSFATVVSTHTTNLFRRQSSRFPLVLK